MAFLTPILKAKKTPRPDARGLEKLAKVHENIIRADMQGALRGFQQSANYDSIKDAVLSGNWKKVYGALPTDSLPDAIDKALGSLGKAVQGGTLEGAKTLGKAVGITGEGADVDPRELMLGLKNPLIREYTETRTGALIENVTDQLQVNVQQAVRWGMRNGASPQDVADRIVKGLPLNTQQEQALANYQNGLRESSLSPKRQAQLVQEYEGRLQAQRAIMIARTESQYAINAGQLMVWQKSQDAGLLPEVCYKVWILGNGDACPLCKDLAGSEIALDDQFVSALGDQVDAPPLHPRCLCGLTLSTRQDAQE